MQCGCFQFAGVRGRLPRKEISESGPDLASLSMRCAVPIRELGIALGVY